jgi:hypothetical protein
MTAPSATRALEWPDITEHALAYADGHALGLDDDQVDDVVDQWLDHARSAGARAPWSRIRGALVHRALGDHWHPPGPA